MFFKIRQSGGACIPQRLESRFSFLQYAPINNAKNSLMCFFEFFNIGFVKEKRT